MTAQDLPAQLAELVTEFHEVPEPDKLQLLLEFSRSLPELPARLGEHPEELEQVTECQSPLFLTVELEGTGPQAPVQLYFSAPAEAPTTRGFASILHEGLNGLPAEQVLAVPDDLPERFGLTSLVSPLRMRGMSAMLGRIKRQITALQAV
ncbi:SufE family protein [Kocuria rhizophila]|uniref:SufE family protein n=1 Tax=Kocuria rhizophila TaxID=72000 RepID=UPI000C87B727|nr:SufE family protein [Kocuria rhizophila]MCT1958684.1 SufE family protein [Kocuria rhizophila]MCT2074608.1 SufE family protein [Kocuria rhizophila]MDR7373911.1 cysteine desulfuration protein SufE [Kocuria rhizophila]PMR89960.1 cysteine desulfuration protein SufE [Kocuria rhizophila]